MAENVVFQVTPYALLVSEGPPDGRRHLLMRDGPAPIPYTCWARRAAMLGRLLSGCCRRVL